MRLTTWLSPAVFGTLALALSLGLATACANDSTDAPEDSAAANEEAIKAPHIQYYGPFDNSVRESKDYANLVWAFPGETNKFARAAEANMNVILAPGGAFFTDDGVLRSDYLARWNKVLAGLGDYKNNVVAVYPRDEPFLWSKENKKKNPLTWQQINDSLEKVNALIHKTLPGAATAVTFSTWELQQGRFAIPGGYDWVGFDCYGSFDNCDGNHSVTFYRDVLAQHMNRKQHLFLVPQAFVWNKTRDPNGEIENIRSIFDSYYALAATDRRVIALLPFSYHDYAGLQGYSHFPRLRDKLAKIGKKVLSSLPPPATSTDAGTTPTSDAGGSTPTTDAGGQDAAPTVDASTPAVDASAPAADASTDAGDIDVDGPGLPDAGMTDDGDDVSETGNTKDAPEPPEAAPSPGGSDGATNSGCSAGPMGTAPTAGSFALALAAAIAARLRRRRR